MSDRPTEHPTPVEAPAAVGVTDAPDPAETGTVTEAPDPVEAEAVAEAPDPAETGTVTEAPDPVEAEAVAEAPDPAETGTVTEAPDPVEAEAVAEAPDPAETGTVTEAPDPVEAEAVAEAPDPAETGTVTEAPDPASPVETAETADAPDPAETIEAPAPWDAVEAPESAEPEETGDSIAHVVDQDLASDEASAESVDSMEARKSAAQADGLIDEAGRVPVEELESGDRLRGWPCDDTGYQIRDEDLRYLGLDDKQVEGWRRFEAPLGMTPEQFKDFTGSLKEALVTDGIDAEQVDIRLQGSSAQFFSGSHKDFPTEQGLTEQPEALARLEEWMGDRPEVDRPARIPFDAKHLLRVRDQDGISEPPSDYDVQLSSDAMVGKAQETWEATDPGKRSPHLIHPKYDFVNKAIAEKSFPALQDWKAHWEGELGREVAPALFPSAGPPDRTGVGIGISTHFRESDWIINRPGGDDRE
ncbi:hypothetical protein [Streptomyces sp. NBC_01236]|uniref:hypothetical protein n=1 Tax=Streptomyces sp. NBC_01236 TaxID=2903789 RepID=UPI002E10BCD7|nr:hypothetical protein OG324_29055 [Streptomyces sp. NBC_01236]